MSIPKGRALRLGAAVGVLYWLAETAAHAYVFETGSYGVHLDARRAYQEKLRKLARAVEQTGDAVLITDLEGSTSTDRNLVPVSVPSSSREPPA